MHDKSFVYRHSLFERKPLYLREFYRVFFDIFERTRSESVDNVFCRYLSYTIEKSARKISVYRLYGIGLYDFALGYVELFAELIVDYVLALHFEILSLFNGRKNSDGSNKVIACIYQ